MQITTSDQGFVPLADELIEEPDGISGTMTASVTAPAETAIGVITLFASEQGNFDNCIVTTDASSVVPEVPEAPEPFVPVDNADNLLSNGDFISSTTAWQSCEGAAVSVNNNSALELGGGCIFQEFEATAGSTYAASCRAGSDEFASVSISYSDVDFVQLAISETVVPGTSLSPTEVADTAPVNTTRGFITLYADDVAVFDDCAVVEL